MTKYSILKIPQFTHAHTHSWKYQISNMNNNLKNNDYDMMKDILELFILFQTNKTD